MLFWIRFQNSFGGGLKFECCVRAEYVAGVADILVQFASGDKGLECRLTNRRTVDKSWKKPECTGITQFKSPSQKKRIKKGSLENLERNKTCTAKIHLKKSCSV